MCEILSQNLSFIAFKEMLRGSPYSHLKTPYSKFNILINFFIETLT